MRTNAWPRILAFRGREYQGPSDTAQLAPGTRWPGEKKAQPKVFSNFIPDKTNFTCVIEGAGIKMTKNELVNNLGMIDEEVAVWSVALTDRAPRAWLCTPNRCRTHPSNGRWITVTGGGAEFIEKPIANGMLGSAETPHKHGGFGGPLSAETYGDEVQSKVKRLLADFGFQQLYRSLPRTDEETTADDDGVRKLPLVLFLGLVMSHKTSPLNDH